MPEMNRVSRDDVFTALSEIETELIALKDAVHIMDCIPIDHPRPVYLVKRISTHTRRLSQSFYRAWDAVMQDDQ